MEGPIDVYCLKIAEKLAPVLHKLGHTPNIVTTYSLISSVISLYSLYHGKFLAFVIFSVFGYIFDCTDGYMARKYKMETKFGDFYDHFTDSATNIAWIYIVLQRYGWKAFKPVFFIGLFFFVLMLVYLGCAQTYHNVGPAKESLDIFRIFAFSPDTFKWARYFSCGTAKLFTILAAGYLEYNKK